LDFVGELFCEIECAVAIEEVWGVQEVDMQYVAFDPFCAVDQSAEESQFIW
jgi:hypothetical protein